MKKIVFLICLVFTFFVFIFSVSAKGKNELSFKKLSELKTKNVENFLFYRLNGNPVENHFYVFNKNLRNPEDVTLLNPGFKLVNVIDNNENVNKQRIYVIEQSNSNLRVSVNKLFERRNESSGGFWYYGTELKYVNNAHGYSLFSAYELDSMFPVGGIESIYCSFSAFEKMFLDNDFRVMKDKSIVFFEGYDKQYFIHTFINTSGHTNVHYIVRKNKKGDKYQYTAYVYTLSDFLDSVTSVVSNRFYANKKSGAFESVKELVAEAISFITGSKVSEIESLSISSTNANTYEFNKEKRFRIATIYTLETDKPVTVVGADILNASHGEMMEILFSGSSLEKKGNEVGKELTLEELKKKIEINNNVNIDNTDTNTNNNADNTKIENNNSNSNSNTNDSINNIKQDTEVKAAFEQTKSVLSTVKDIPRFFSSVIDMFPGSIKTLIYLSFTLLFIAFILKIFL